MMHLVYLKVAKVGSQNADMTTSIERTVVTLESGKNFDNFVKHLHVQNFLTIEAEKPTVIKVVEWKDGKPGKEVDKTDYVNKVKDALTVVKNAGQPIDYKSLSEKQSAKISEMEQMMQSFNERLKEAENKNINSAFPTPTPDTMEESIKMGIRNKLEVKANELNIDFRSSIGDENLLKKIQAIEPDYKL
jgi:hypothetical protein